MDSSGEINLHPTMNGSPGKPGANSHPDKENLYSTDEDRLQAYDKMEDETEKSKKVVEEMEKEMRKRIDKEIQKRVDNFEIKKKLKRVEINVGGFFIALANFALDRGAKDDDDVDRLNHMIMYGLFMLLAGGAGMKMFVGDPIRCWIPAQYKEDRYRDYVNNYCFTHTMYNVHFGDMIPHEESDRYFNPICFYRWIAVFFIMLAAMYRVPQRLWKELKKLAGANLEKMNWILARLRSAVDNCKGRRSGHFLVGLYLFIKILYLVNTVGQFYLISRFIRTNFWSFGADAISTFAEEGIWEDHYIFPRIALCDFQIRQLQNIQTFTVQCVLSVNHFLEKMFVLVWVCLIIVLIANAASLLKWIYQLVLDSSSEDFLVTYPEHLVFGNRITTQEKEDFRKMVKTYLQPDGVFLLRMLAINTSDVVVLDLLRKIWARYQTQEGKSQ